MKQFVVFLIIFFLAVPTTVCSLANMGVVKASDSSTRDFSTDTNTSVRQSSWTVMVYLDGDIADFMEGAAIDDFNEMEAAPSNPAINVVVQFDRNPGGDSSNGDWTTTRRYLVSHDTDPAIINSTMIADLGELNMGDPTTLVNFVQWAIQDYPAENYMLILWDHGSGWRTMASSFQKSVCADDSSGGDSLSLQELGNALNLINMSTGVKLDILGFDACMMGMLEVDYQIRQYVDYRVGSEETEPADGWNYEAILTALASNPSMNSSELASHIIDDYFIPYGTNGEETMSATNLNLVNNVITAMDTFTQCLVLDVNNASSGTEIIFCRDNTQLYYDAEFVDLYDFTSRVNGNPNLPAATKTAASTLMTAISSYVIDEQHGTASPGSHGLSIYYPSIQQTYETQYDSLTFATDTNWNEWLKTGIAVGDVYEPDNTWAQAHGISVLTSISSERHTINPEGDKDYYQFSVSSDSLGTYQFYTSGSTDTYGYLYNSTYAELIKDDDGGAGFNFLIQYNITASGTYYVMVRGFYDTTTRGSYTIYYKRTLQYQVTFNYQVSGGGSRYSAPSVTYTSLGLLKTVTANSTATVWADSGSTYTYMPNPLTGSGTSERWYASSDTSGTISSSATINPTYYHQYLVTFAQSGLSSDASGTVVTAFGVAKTYGQLPNSTWVDSDGSVTFSYASTVSSSVSGKQYVLTGANASSPLTVSGATKITGSYKTQYQVTFTVSPSEGGSTNPSGSNVWEDAGSTISITTTPNAGYTFSSWSSNTGSITFSNPNSASTTATISRTGTITASFAINTFTISASAGANGAISPSGSVVVNYGGSQSFTITANTGYHIVDVVVDDVSQGAVSSYTFSNVQAAHSISASFAINTHDIPVTQGANDVITTTVNYGGTYTITVTQGANGVITPGTTTVNYGESQSFTITPNSGYYIASITTDAGSVTVTSPSGQTVSFSNVQAAHSITATFASATTVPATTDSGATVDLAISGNITSSQISNVTIATNQSAATTTVSFIVTGESGTTGFGNVTIPRSALPYGTTPTIYIDNQPAQDQSYAQDSNNYYVWYTTHFSTHQVSIMFTTTSPSPSPTAQSSLPPEAIYGIATAVAIVAIVIAVTVLKKRSSSHLSPPPPPT